MSRHVLIDGRPGHQRIVVDGKDIADQCVAVDIHMGPDWHPRVTLTLAPGTIEIVMPEATVSVAAM